MTPALVHISPLIITMQAPLRIGTGYRHGLVHRTIQRDGRGNVYLPATGLKGKVRSVCEALLTTYGLPPCRAPYPRAMEQCRPLDSVPDKRAGCLVCRVFGAPGRGSNLFWHDAVLIGWPEDSGNLGQSAVRTQVQLNRARGLAAEEHLFASEASAPGLVFRSERGIVGRVELTPLMDEADQPYEMILLLAGLRLLAFVGGDTSRGLGACQVTLPETIRVDDRTLAVADLLAQVEYLPLWGEEGGQDRG